MIIQNAGVGGKTDFTFTVHATTAPRPWTCSRTISQPFHEGGHRRPERSPRCPSSASACVQHVGIAALMFGNAVEEGINIQMISTSEIKISVVIDEKYMELAVRALHPRLNSTKAAAALAVQWREK